MFKCAFVILFFGLICGVGLADDSTKTSDTLFQVSTIGALMNGIYDGAATCGELKQRGDFGLGTFEALDGEMVMLEGDIYQVRSDGNVLRAADRQQTPFAAITYFHPDRVVGLEKIENLDQLERLLEPQFANRNLFQAIRIDARFNRLRVRSVPRQKKPYPPLAKAAREQTIFDFSNTSGTLVGFWCPVFAEGLNVPGFHLHYISTDRAHGGHVLQCSLLEGQAQIDETPDWHMHLPDNSAFRQTDLARDWGKAMNAVEKSDSPVFKTQ